MPKGIRSAIAVAAGVVASALLVLPGAAVAAGTGGVSAAPVSAAPGVSRGPARVAGVWVKDCPLSRFKAEPPGFVVACADGSISFRRLHWVEWGQPTTVGVGVLREQTANGLVVERATLTLSQIERHGGRSVYGYADVQPSAPNRYHLPSFGYDLLYG